MIITLNEMQALKAVPNSAYSVIKPELLYHSNKMEGSTFTKEELERLIDEQNIVGEHPLNDLLETVNSLEVFDHVIDTLGEPVTHDYLFRLNKLLFTGTSQEKMGWTGHYKELSNYIKNSKVQLALPFEVEAMMCELITQWEDKSKTLEGIAHLHARFEHIHPFQDGNGRIGRLLMMKQCIENEVDLILITNDSAPAYRSWLEVAQTDNNFRFFVDLLRDSQVDFDTFVSGHGITKESITDTASKVDSNPFIEGQPSHEGLVAQKPPRQGTSAACSC